MYCFSTMTGKLEQSLQVCTIYFLKLVLSEASSNQQIACLIGNKKLMHVVSSLSVHIDHL